MSGSSRRRPLNTRATAACLLALYGLLLVVPSANYHVFDGLPASRLPEFLGLALLAPFLVSRGLRRLHGRLVGAAGPVARRGLLALGVLSLLAKLVLLTSATHAGFLACYRSPLAVPPAGACERSYENPFFRFGATRIDRVLDFTPRTWDLSFVNSLRFSFYTWVPGNVRRDRLPLAVTWTATVERRRAWTAEIGYVGVVAIQVDSMEPTRLETRYDALAVARVPVPAGRHRLTVDYAFDDASRVGDGRVLGPYATFRLARVHEATGGAALVRSARPARGWRWTGTAVDVVVILFAATLGATCALVVNRDAWVPAAVAAAAAGRHLWVGDWPSVPASTWLFLLLVPLLGHLALDARPRRLLGAYFGVLAAALFLVSGRFGRLNMVESRKAGDDWLTYESFARSTLETWSLRGAEDVFYYQPLVRYLRFAEHLGLGDGHPLISTWVIVALTWSLLWMCAMAFGRRRAPVRTLALLLPGLLLLLLATSRTVLAMLHAGVSEYPTWIALPLFLPLLFVSSSPRAWRRGTTLLGLSLLARMNHLPAVLVTLTLFVWRGRQIRPRAAMGAALLFAALALLPTLHNAYYGGRFVPLTKSAGISANLTLPPARLLDIAHDGEVRAQLRLQIGRALYVGGDRAVLIAVRGLLLMWVVAVGAWALTGRAGLPLALLVGLPVGYLAPHLLYASTYYPRHFIAGYLATGAVVLLTAARWDGSGRRGGSGEGPGPATWTAAERVASR